jgi:hypothetical protein
VSDQKREKLEPGDLVQYEITGIPLTSGVQYEDLRDMFMAGFRFMGVIPIRREITAAEKLNPLLEIPPGQTHVIEPTIVFMRGMKVEPPEGASIPPEMLPAKLRPS